MKTHELALLRNLLLDLDAEDWWSSGAMLDNLIDELDWLILEMI